MKHLVLIMVGMLVGCGEKMKWKNQNLQGKIEVADLISPAAKMK